MFFHRNVFEMPLAKSMKFWPFLRKSIKHANGKSSPKLIIITNKQISLPLPHQSNDAVLLNNSAGDFQASIIFCDYKPKFADKMRGALETQAMISMA